MLYFSLWCTYTISDSTKPYTTDTQNVLGIIVIAKNYVCKWVQDQCQSDLGIENTKQQEPNFSLRSADMETAFAGWS